MNTHLQLVREFHQQFGIAQADAQSSQALSDMDIVMRQALLLACTRETFEAIAEGDMPQLLAGIIDLAYNALAAIACRGDNVMAGTGSWRQDGSVLSLVKALSDKVNACTSGETVDYSALYRLCQQITQGFINADFDGAFRQVHASLMASHTPYANSGHDYASRLAAETLPAAPDLSAFLFE
jgi:hypothetical protein